MAIDKFIFQIVLAIVLIVIIHDADMFEATKSEIYCSSVDKNNSGRGAIMITILFLMEIAAIFLLRLLLHINIVLFSSIINLYLLFFISGKYFLPHRIALKLDRAN